MNIFPIEEEKKKEIFTKYAKISQVRGEPNKELDQYFISRETSLKKALLFDPQKYQNKWIVFLGDMDLVSLSLGLLSKTRDLVVLDIDKRIPEIIFSMKFDYKIRSARFVNHDLRIRMLAVLKNQYDFIFVESPMTIEANEVCLSRAVQCAKKDGKSKIILSTDLPKDEKEILNSLFEVMNLELIEYIKDFNEYEHQTPLGKNTSDLYILRVKKDSEETISDHYLGPYYFRETGKDIYPFRCRCGEIIEVGEKKKYTSLQKLKEKGCPNCGHKEIFVYNSSIDLS